MRQGPFLLRSPHEHGDRGTDTLIDVNDKNLLLVANENRAATACGNHSAHLHFDNRLAHTASLASRLIASRPELSVRTGNTGRSLFLDRIDNPLLDLRIKVNLLQNQVATRKPFRRLVHGEFSVAEIELRRQDQPSL